VPKLAAVDLNLLVALDALLSTENVTAAGKAIGASQPAMSHALSRLRELLEDQILVRAGRGMQRTSLAKQLTPVVRQILDDVEATLFARRHFDPASSRRTFRVGANDYCGAVLLPALIEQTSALAPGVRLDIHAPPDRAPLDELARGDLDVVLGTFQQVSAPLCREELFQEEFVCLLRRGHPLRARLTPARYAELEHVLVANPGYGPGVVDFALAARGLSRRVAVKVPHFLVAPAIVARTDYVLTLPRRVARAAASANLRLLEPPLELEGFPVELIWHQRGDADAGVVWLCQQIRRAARTG